jgi:hypothetical protein
MTVTLFVTLVVVVLAAGLFVFRAIPGVRAYFEYRGKRLITCPETHQQPLMLTPQKPRWAHFSRSPRFT